MRPRSLFLLPLMPSGAAASCPAQSPVQPLNSSLRPDKIWQDDKGVPINAHGGGILFHEGTYYWFGEHKIDGPSGNFAHVGVHVYSSKNRTEWRDNWDLGFFDVPASAAKDQGDLTSAKSESSNNPVVH